MVAEPLSENEHMRTEKKEFQGKDVQEAIQKACKILNASQENLDIEIVTTGSSGIFGLCRKKARLLVAPKEQTPPATKAPAAAKAGTGKSRAKKPRPPVVTAGPKSDRRPLSAPHPTPFTLTPAMRETIEADIRRVLELMGYPAEVTIKKEGDAVIAILSGDYDAEVIGPGGRTLDSLQYIIRKIANKKFSEKIMLSLDVGDFRATRMKELEELSRKLAVQVKETGKTRTTPALNPSERRIVHMALQDDKDIRSRSVGEGLFKKILIYRPGGRKNTTKKRK